MLYSGLIQAGYSGEYRRVGKEISSKKSSSLLERIPLHTLLLSTYPILFVYSKNIQNIRLEDTIRLLGISAVFFGFLLLLFQLVLKNWLKAGLLSSFSASLYYSFGHAANALQQLVHQQKFIFSIDVLGWVWLILFLAGSYLILQFESPEKATSLLNITGSVLLITTALSIFTTADVNQDLTTEDFSRLAALRGEKQAESSRIPLNSPNLPDIYLIIFDGYVRSDILQTHYEYDNSNFTQALEERGFYQATNSHSNYLNTNYSFNTLMNLVYFHHYPEDLFIKTKYNLYTNYVHDFLTEYGYRTVVFDSGTGDTNDQEADLFLSPWETSSENSSGLNAFEPFFLRTTLALLLFQDQSAELQRGENTNLIRESVNRELSKRRERIQFTLNHLPDFSSQEQPHFIFAHIYLPHIPFLYGPRGEELTYHGDQSLYWYEVDPENYQEYYTYQIDYLNEAILEVIDEIQMNADRPQVIILQSDHGDEYFLDRENPTALGVQVRSAILNAVYFSDGSYGSFYPTMTPVNTFRLVFNHWLGTGYPLLEDKVFFHEHPLSTGIAEKPEFVDACPRFEICLPPAE